jgi:hypothetical protein
MHRPSGTSYRVFSRSREATDGAGQSFAVAPTPGQRHDGAQLSVVLDSIQGRAGLGRPRPCAVGQISA